MQQAEFDHRDFEPGSQQALDEGLLVKFYLAPRKDDEKSVEEGRPVYREVEYVDIRVPGDRDGVARPATPRDRSRFPRHYAAFKNRMDTPDEGTLLSEWPLVPRTMVEELAYFNVKTVEALASMSDGNGQKFHGINALKQKAVDWLAKAKGDAVEVKLREEIVARDAKIEEQASLLGQLSDRLIALEKAAKDEQAPKKATK
jgi:hypothetical protein